MKILAATPKQYSETTYIAELTSNELLALLCLDSYTKLEVTDEEGKNHFREKDNIISGDVIHSTKIKETLIDIQHLRGCKQELDKACSLMKGSMTKIQNIINPEIK